MNLEAIQLMITRIKAAHNHAHSDLYVETRFELYSDNEWAVAIGGKAVLIGENIDSLQKQTQLRSFAHLFPKTEES